MNRHCGSGDASDSSSTSIRGLVPPNGTYAPVVTIAASAIAPSLGYPHDRILVADCESEQLLGVQNPLLVPPTGTSALFKLKAGLGDSHRRPYGKDLNTQ